MADPRAVGDYGARFYGGAAPTSRTTLYTADTNVRGYIRHVGVINTGGTDRTITFWLGGVQVTPAINIPANDTRAMDVSMWLLRSGDLLEAQASGAGLNLVVFGVEEVYTP